MVMVLNRAPGPRMFNVKGAAAGAALQVTLMPGESRDLDLLTEDDPVLQGWIEADHVLVGSDAKKFLAKRQPAPEQVTARLAALRAEVAELEALQGVADPSLLTPPHQLGGDGGPEQMPTVDGRAGAPTPTQGEGTPEQKLATAVKAPATVLPAHATAAKPKPKD